MTKTSPKKLDHLALPVPDLETARARYTKLGFNVGPEGHHQFGTENACIPFANGTFIEPLAIGQRETVEDAIRKGNTFLVRDAAFRFRHGENGFWGVSLASEDTKLDRKRFRKAGYRTGKLVQVKRTGVHARLAFAIDERAPDFAIFHCQDMINMPPLDKERVTHENGAKRIAAVYAYEHLPEDFQYYFQTATAQREVRSHSFGMEMKLPNATLHVLNPQGTKAYLGVTDLPKVRGLRAMALDVEVASLDTVQKLLAENSIPTRKMGSRLLVDQAQGQGAIIGFVEG